MNDEHYDFDQAEINAQRRNLKAEQAAELKRPFTVVGFYEESGQICADQFQAKDAPEAMRLAASYRIEEGDGTYSLVCAFPTVEGLDFPGESAVEAQDYLDLFVEEINPHGMPED